MEEQFNPEDSFKNQMIINAIKQYMPDAPKYYPALEAVIDNIRQEIANYLGDNKKTVLSIRNKGQTRVIVLDNSKPFTYDSVEGFTGSHNAIIVNKSDEDFLNEKIYSNPIFAWFKQEYEEKYKEGDDGSAMKLLQGGQ